MAELSTATLIDELDGTVMVRSAVRPLAPLSIT
jgi:hypothetical protein